MSRSAEFRSLPPAVEKLRLDAQSNQLCIYDIPHFPTGVIHPKYLEKCASVVVGVSGSGNLDYLVVMPQRLDHAKTVSGKDMDLDPVVFCFKGNANDAFPTGLALFHQNFSGRTQPVSGYDSFTMEQTLADLRQQLITGALPWDGNSTVYLNAISHSIVELNYLLGPQIGEWNKPPL